MCGSCEMNTSCKRQHAEDMQVNGHLRCHAANVARLRHPWHLSHCQRRRSKHAAVNTAGPRELWGYPSSNVKTIDLDSFRLMHRASFSHRNVRTYVVVVYVPGSTRCAEVEREVERLASGLAHEPRVVVARLNALGSSEAFMFSTGTLEVTQYPTIFLYPEGSPGYMRFTGDEVAAETLISAVNACYKRILQGRKPLELRADAFPAWQGATAAAEAVTRSGVEADTPTASLQASTTVAAAGPHGRLALESRPEQQQVLKSLSSMTQGYWTPGKVAFWVAMTLFGVGALCWDRWGEDWLARRTLLDRQRRRAEGEHFDPETDIEDLMDLALLETSADTKGLTKEEAIRRAGQQAELGLLPWSPGQALASARSSLENPTRTEGKGWPSGDQQGPLSQQVSAADVGVQDSSNEGEQQPQIVRLAGQSHAGTLNRIAQLQQHTQGQQGPKGGQTSQGG